MGEWSEHFADFPEEDPGNYDELGKFDPAHRVERNERKRLANERLAQAPRSSQKSTGKAPPPGP